MSTLLSREDFKRLVFERDDQRCVMCGEPAVDAHHIIDRSLWEDGGYYLNNGVALCAEHHLMAETTELTGEDLRAAADEPLSGQDIRWDLVCDAKYPPHLGLNEFVKDYDKWGNPILKNGKRLKGYYFEQENVQKMLKAGNVLHLFEKDREMIVDKYPRSYHVQSSPGTTSDDRIAKTIGMLCRGEIVMTEKMDGSNTSLSKYGVYGRSRTAPSENGWDAWLKPMWQMMKNDLGDLEICGENMYGVHSIEYSGLDSHFYIFGIRDTARDFWLSWEEVEFYAKMLDLPTVPVLFRSDKNFRVEENWIYNKIDELVATPSLKSDERYGVTPKEGVVIRLAGEFPNDMFYNSLAKWVRKGHVTTDEHWTKNWKRAKLLS